MPDIAMVVSMYTSRSHLMSYLSTTARDIEAVVANTKSKNALVDAVPISVELEALEMRIGEVR